MARAASTPPSTDLPSAVLAHVRRIIHAIHAQSAAIESHVGLTGPQFWALREIATASDDGLSLGDIARRLALHPANAGRLVDRLAAKDLVTRAGDARDKRVVVVRATSAGKKLVLTPVGAPAQADLLVRLGGLPKLELARIERTLGRLVELIGASEVEPGPLFDKPSGPRRTPRH